MVLVQVIRTGIQIASRITGYGRVGKYSKAFARYDRQLHGSVFGRSGGRGFRHGRDAGLAVASAAQGYNRGDIGDAVPFQSGRNGNTSRTKSKAYRRRRVKCRPRRTNNYSRYRK